MRVLGVLVLLCSSAAAADLPRSWNWCTGENPAGPTPAWQARRIADGDPLVPHIEFYAFHKWSDVRSYVEPGVQAAQERNLPVIFVYQNLFDTFRTREPWKSQDWSSQPADHPFQIEADTGQVKKRLSFWSNRTDFAYQLGVHLATSDFVRQCARMYPKPPLIVFADNNEVGFLEKPEHRLGDVRVPERIRKLQQLVESAEGDAKVSLQAQLDDVLEDASRLGHTVHYAAFRRGFNDGLRTHNEHWASVTHWIAYGQSGNEYGAIENATLERWADFRYEGPWSGAAGQDHPYRHDWGPTGQLYVQPWYGGFHVLRTVIQGDNARWGMELRESQGFTPPRFQLVWEGRNTKLKDLPNREQWRGLIRYWLWTTHADYFGHFAASKSTVQDPSISSYYDEVIKACREVHDNPLLRDFWLNGEIEPSTDKTPYEWPNATHPALLGQPRRFCLLHVDEQQRYEGETDTWVRDRTRRQPVNVLALSIRHKDGRRLVYVAGLEEPFEQVSVTVPTVGVRKMAAPLGGTFQELPAQPGGTSTPRVLFPTSQRLERDDGTSRREGSTTRRGPKAAPRREPARNR